MKKRTLAITSALLSLIFLLCSCNSTPASTQNGSEDSGLGDDSKSFGAPLKELGAYDGYFDGESADVVVSCVSGTDGAYTLEGTTLTFTALGADSVYSISGRLRGNIVIDVGDDYKLDLELSGLSLISSTTSPIYAKSGNEISVTAKKDTRNFIYDTRKSQEEDGVRVFRGAIASMVDLEVCGKGALTIVSEHNDGIYTKDDLQIKNLSLLVACSDNAAKGNDSVSLESANVTLIASDGDGIKTKNSDVSSKGKQRGTVSVTGSTLNVYAACDGIDAEYDFVCDGESNVNVYTDKYSNYSNVEIKNNSESYFIRYLSKVYKYSVKFFNTEDDATFVNAEHFGTVSGKDSKTYHYFSLPKTEGYANMQLYVYTDTMEQGGDSCFTKSEVFSVNDAYDTIAIENSAGGLNISWTNYEKNVTAGDFGGLGKSGSVLAESTTTNTDHSAKGIKVNNQISLRAGNVTIKSYDDCLSAGGDKALDNSKDPLGYVNVLGGTLTLWSNGNAINADGAAELSAGTVDIFSSYKGVVGNTVVMSGGIVSVNAKDDGMFSGDSKEIGITLGEGFLYVLAGGDGIRSSTNGNYEAVAFNGAYCILATTSKTQPAVNTERGYKYAGGAVLAITSSNSAAEVSAKAEDFASIGCTGKVNTEGAKYVSAVIGELTVTSVIPTMTEASIIVLGSSEAQISTTSSAPAEMGKMPYFWK